MYIFFVRSDGYLSAETAVTYATLRPLLKNRRVTFFLSPNPFTRAEVQFNQEFKITSLATGYHCGFGNILHLIAVITNILSHLLGFSNCCFSTGPLHYNCERFLCPSNNYKPSQQTTDMCTHIKMIYSNRTSYLTQDSTLLKQKQGTTLSQFNAIHVFWLQYALQRLFRKKTRDHENKVDSLPCADKFNTPRAV